MVSKVPLAPIESRVDDDGDDDRRPVPSQRYHSQPLPMHSRSEATAAAVPHRAAVPTQEELEPEDETTSLRGLQMLPREKALAFARAEFERGGEEMLQQCRAQIAQVKSPNAKHTLQLAPSLI